MRTSVLGFLLLLLPAGDGRGAWRSLAPGMDLGVFTATRPRPVGDSRLTVLRIDPALWDLELAGQRPAGEARGRTARQWSKERKLAAVINAGMFAADYKTHVGYMRAGEQVNNGRANGYESVAAFGPRREGLPRFRIFDLDAPGVALQTILRDYGSVVQNLRLIKRPGLNRWSRQEKRWSEAALGEDGQGRILFLFSRTPFSMHELNRELLALGIGLVSAQHLEGGPEAQLYVRVGDFELELFGSFETAFREDDGNRVAWPIPNVLGVRPR